MIVRLLFKGNKCNGYLLYFKEVYPYDEEEGVTMVETNTEEMGNMLGQEWREKFPSLILLDGEIAIDEDWEPETVDE